MTREEREQALLEELKSVKGNVITIMENRIMSMAGCNRQTANLIANEILDLDRETNYLLPTPTEKIKREISWERLSDLATDAIYGMFEAEPYDAVEFCREKDLSETEIEYLIADCHKKYFNDEDNDDDVDDEDLWLCGL